MFKKPEEIHKHLKAKPSEIERFVKGNPESHILDYKSWCALKKPATQQEDERLARVICSFANSDGGVILFGICNNPRGIEKHKFTEGEIENLQQTLSQQINPPVWFANHECVTAKRGCQILLSHPGKPIHPSSQRRYVHLCPPRKCLPKSIYSRDRRPVRQTPTTNATDQGIRRIHIPDLNGADLSSVATCCCPRNIPPKEETEEIRQKSERRRGVYQPREHKG